MGARARAQVINNPKPQHDETKQQCQAEESLAKHSCVSHIVFHLSRSFSQSPTASGFPRHKLTSSIHILGLDIHGRISTPQQPCGFDTPESLQCQVHANFFHQLHKSRLRNLFASQILRLDGSVIGGLFTLCHGKTWERLRNVDPPVHPVFLGLFMTSVPPATSHQPAACETGEH
jgi:hypothetical protein